MSSQINFGCTLIPAFDRFFAEYWAKTLGYTDEDFVYFLTYLSMSIQTGNLCVRDWQGVLFPNPVDVLLKMTEISADEIFLNHWKEKTTLGAKKASCFFKTHNYKNPFVFDENRFYTQKNWFYETEIIKNFKKLIETKPSVTIDLPRLELKLAELMENQVLHTSQAEAIRKSISHSIAFLTGGPGTGKTYTAAYIIKLLTDCLLEMERESLQVVLVAPTGKATGNLQQSITKVINDIPFSIHSMTLHKMLDSFPLQTPFDLIMIDEASMIDAELMSRLLKSVKEGARILFIGDEHQLPPIEIGSFFCHMTKLPSAASYVVKLEKCLRTERKNLLDLAQAVKEGDLSAFFSICQSSVEDISYHSFLEDYKMMQRIIFERVQKRLFFWAKTENEAEEKFLLFNRFRILTPLRKGVFGVEELNQKILHFLMQKVPKNSFIYIPIVITQNSRTKNLFNGDLGVLIHKVQKDQEILREGWLNEDDFALFFSHGEWKKIPALLLPFFEPAYCFSIHKSQGSEFDDVLVLLPPGSEFFERELLYTAVTRAKKRIEIFANRNTIEKVIKRKDTRESGFMERFDL